MTTYGERGIERAVKEAAENYAAFINGIVDESWSGFVVHGNGEFVYFDKKYAGTSHYYIPCRYDIVNYVVEARICVGGEEVELVL